MYIRNMKKTHLCKGLEKKYLFQNVFRLLRVCCSRQGEASFENHRKHAFQK